jgi:cell division protein FtsL|tara:strand:+ start:73 stop:414 length:342 start_codon:yes stop_codon:yes gene_type:complete
MSKDLENGARSFKSQTIGSDSFALTINIKWLLQIIALIIGLTVTFYQYQMKITAMEDDIEQHRKDIEELIAHHQAEESARIELLEESVKWYEKELVKVGNVSLNPFSWKKRKK